MILIYRKHLRDPIYLTFRSFFILIILINLRTILHSIFNIRTPIAIINLYLRTVNYQGEKSNRIRNKRPEYRPTCA